MASVQTLPVSRDATASSSSSSFWSQFFSRPSRPLARTRNIVNVLQQNSVIGIIACGMTFAIILGASISRLARDGAIQRRGATS